MGSDEGKIANRFKLTKMKMILKREEDTLRTSTTSTKVSDKRPVLDELPEFDANYVREDHGMTTMKQVNEKERGIKKEVIRCLTDRTYTK